MSQFMQMAQSNMSAMMVAPPISTPMPFMPTDYNQFMQGMQAAQPFFPMMQPQAPPQMMASVTNSTGAVSQSRPVTANTNSTVVKDAK